MEERGVNTLGFLAIAGSIMMTTMYSDGDFDAWDVLPGVFLISVIGMYWNRIEASFWPNLALGIIGGGACLMINGFWIEWLLSPYEDQKLHDLHLTLIWAGFALAIYVLRRMVHTEPGEECE